MRYSVLALLLSLCGQEAQGRILQGDFVSRMLAGEQSGCRAVKQSDQCTSMTPRPQCTPYRSIDYCATDESFQTYISQRTTIVRQAPEKLGNYWFDQLENKLAGYTVAASLGLNPPKIFKCSNDLSELEAFESKGFVVRATNLHSSKGIYVLPDGFGGKEAIRDITMEAVDVISDLKSLDVNSYIIEEYIPNHEVSPMEFKFHMIGGSVASINVVSNRGEDCACWAEIDVDQNRLDKYGCFVPGGSEEKEGKCTRVDFQSGVDNVRPMKGMDICSDLPSIDDCVMKDMVNLAVKASKAIGVYVRVDMFLGPNGDIYVQEFSTNHMNGLRHCSAVVDQDGCVDPCYQGRMWKDAGGNSLFGGPETDVPAELKEWLALPSDDDKCKSIESTQIEAPPASSCPTTPAPAAGGPPTSETGAPSDAPVAATETKSPVAATETKSPVAATETKSPVAPTAGPVAKTPSPVAKTESPVAKTPSPVAKTESPVAKTPSPVAKTESPVAKTPSPVAKTESPVAKTPAPVAKTEAPIAKTQAPVAKTESPAAPTEAPVKPSPSPVAPTEAPVKPSPSPVAPTESPVAPTEAPVKPSPSPVAPTEAPVKPSPSPVAPTEAPVARTEAPVKPSPSPVAPTESPVAPTEAPIKPTQSPVAKTPAPVPNTPTPVATGPTYTCGALPQDTNNYAVISESDSKLQIQNLNGGGLLVGGDLSGGQNYNIQTNPEVFVGGTVTGSWQQKQNIDTSGTVSDRVDFDHLQYLALNAKSTNADGYKVVKYTTGGTFQDDDVLKGVDKNSRCNNPNKYLVVFDTTDPVTIQVPQNNNLCYSVLAPFATLTIDFLSDNPGETKGFLVGKAVAADGKNYNLRPFDGQIACDSANPAPSTPAPISSPTNAPAPTDQVCQLPADQEAANSGGFAKYSLITKGDANIGAHNIYSAIAVGGTLRHAGSGTSRPSLKINSNSNLATTSYALSKSGVTMFDFGKGTLQVGGDPLTNAGVDFSTYEYLARNVKESTDANDNKVFVVDQGDAGGTYELYDFRDQGQGEDNGKTLVFFTGTGPVSLTNSGGRQFGPSVIAPFATVILQGDVGFIDGFVVSRRFDTTGSVSTPQMHGNGFLGSLTCGP